MIFDTSVWIDFLKGSRTKKAELLESSIKDYLPVNICPPIYQEVLQGIKLDSKFEETKHFILSLNFLYLDPFFVTDEAVNIYRGLRKKGITIERPNDCLIAFYAIHFKLPLVHNDSDFDKIARHTSLKIRK